MRRVKNNINEITVLCAEQYELAKGYLIYLLFSFFLFLFYHRVTMVIFPPSAPHPSPSCACPFFAEFSHPGLSLLSRSDSNFGN